VEVQQSIEVQAMAKTQQKAMEMERRESEVVAKRRCIIMDRATLLEKGIKIPDPDRFMWT
jgi:TPP-dependent indolepyruvate ferredoxin oxidoreductase alpha subunit